MKNSLTDLEIEILKIYYLTETSLYNETIANILKKDIKDVDVAIEKLEKMGLIKEKN